MSSIAFWTENQVGLGRPYETLDESIIDLARRGLDFPTLYELMPVDLPGKAILDYGCGPGHDTIAFTSFGAGHVFYYDISPLAMEITERRLELHDLANRASPVEHRLIPLVDHIHCAGVLHHTEDPLSILKDFRRLLRTGGEVRVMIYDGERSIHSQSKVPITEWWTELEFSVMAHMAGFDAEYVGSYPCSAPWRPGCYAACYRLT